MKRRPIYFCLWSWLILLVSWRAPPSIEVIWETKLQVGSLIPEARFEWISSGREDGYFVLSGLSYSTLHELRVQGFRVEVRRSGDGAFSASAITSAIPANLTVAAGRLVVDEWFSDGLVLKGLAEEKDLAKILKNRSGTESYEILAYDESLGRLLVVPLYPNEYIPEKNLTIRRIGLDGAEDSIGAGLGSDLWFVHSFGRVSGSFVLAVALYNKRSDTFRFAVVDSSGKLLYESPGIRRSVLVNPKVSMDWGTWQEDKPLSLYFLSTPSPTDEGGLPRKLMIHEWDVERGRIYGRVVPLRAKERDGNTALLFMGRGKVLTICNIVEGDNHKVLFFSWPSLRRVDEINFGASSIACVGGDFNADGFDDIGVFAVHNQIVDIKLAGVQPASTPIRSGGASSNDQQHRFLQKPQSRQEMPQLLLWAGLRTQWPSF